MNDRVFWHVFWPMFWPFAAAFMFGMVLAATLNYIGWG